MSDLKDLMNSLTNEEIIDIMTKLGADRFEEKGNAIIFPTICHNHDSADASMKLYYYPKTHTFHCYTECGDSSFDIYDLVVKVNQTAGIKNFSLSKAIIFVAKYFGYTADTFDFEDNQVTIEDWKIINNFKNLFIIKKCIANNICIIFYIFFHVYLM